MLSHQVFVDVLRGDATADRHWLEVQAEQIEGKRLSAGRPIESVISAIDETARDLESKKAAHGAVPSAVAAATMLGRYVHTALTGARTGPRQARASPGRIEIAKAPETSEEALLDYQRRCDAEMAGGQR